MYVPQYCLFLGTFFVRTFYIEKHIRHAYIHRVLDEKRLKKRATEEDERLELMAKGNIAMMDKVVKIIPQELLEHTNYENYLLKYGAFTF